MIADDFCQDSTTSLPFVRTGHPPPLSFHCLDETRSRSCLNCTAVTRHVLVLDSRDRIRLTWKSCLGKTRHSDSHECLVSLKYLFALSSVRSQEIFNLLLSFNILMWIEKFNNKIFLSLLTGKVLIILATEQVGHSCVRALVEVVIRFSPKTLVLVWITRLQTITEHSQITNWTQYYHVSESFEKENEDE